MAKTLCLPENKKKRAQRANDKYHNDITFKLHTIISVCINKCLIHGKGGVSINKILNPFSAIENLGKEFAVLVKWRM